MTWQIEFGAAAKRELEKLDKPIARRIVSFLREQVLPLENPRTIGDALKGARLGEFWRYRVGNFRIICRIEDSRLVILVLRVGHPREIYRP